ncbi:MAG: type II toxin-antitoxin system RelE/ParE family toxin [Rickettsiales bacterium]
MSYRKKYTLIISPKARQDFTDILRYTAEMWGEKQMLAYRDKIDSALKNIKTNPSIGHIRNDLPDTHMACLVGSHIIIYRKQDNIIGVVRILHQRMCAEKYTD